MRHFTQCLNTFETIRVYCPELLEILAKPCSVFGRVHPISVDIAPFSKKNFRATGEFLIFNY